MSAIERRRGFDDCGCRTVATPFPFSSINGGRDDKTQRLIDDIGEGLGCAANRFEDAVTVAVKANNQRYRTGGSGNKDWRDVDGARSLMKVLQIERIVVDLID